MLNVPQQMPPVQSIDEAAEVISKVLTITYPLFSSQVLKMLQAYMNELKILKVIN